MNENPKEVAVFKTYTKNNKLKVFGISMLIIIVALLALYFPIKTLFKYTVTYHLNGGSIYKQELVSKTYKFLERVEEPAGIKKFGKDKDGNEIGYYIDHWSKKEDLSDVFTFGGKMWRSFHLYIAWEEGVAVRLHFAENEENEDMTTDDLKGYYEQYIKPGSDYTLPLMYNNKIDSSRNHYGEQLIWYDNEDCTGEPFFTKTYTNLTESIDIYGKWIDTSEDKFDIDSNGTLQKYNGYCNKVMLPSSVKAIKSIERDRFKTGYGDTIHDQGGEYYSVWAHVVGGSSNPNNSNYNPFTLREVYINPELRSIGDCAFKDCNMLEKIVFMGDNVESIGISAFESCSSLKNFVMPSKVQTIGSYAFGYAFDRNANVSLALNNVYRVEDFAFVNSNISSITLAKVSFIGRNAFSACGKLGRFEITSQNVVTSNVDTSTNSTYTNEEGLFYSTFTTVAYANKLEIIVPKGMLSAYLNLPYWSMYSTVIKEAD